MMNSHLDEEFMTVAEAARLVKVSPSTIWRWVDAGKVTAYRVGERGVRLSKADLATMVQPRHRKEVRMGKEQREQIGIFKMSPTEADDQEQLLAEARALQERIIERRHGKLLPSSWRTLNEARDERTAQL